MATMLSKAMKIIRIERDISMRQMGEMFGWTAAYLSSIENGKCKLPSNYYVIACDRLSLNQEERIRVLKAVLELQNNYLADLLTERHTGLLNKIFELFEKLKGFAVDKIEEINFVVKEITETIEEIISVSLGRQHPNQLSFLF